MSGEGDFAEEKKRPKLQSFGRADIITFLREYELFIKSFQLGNASARHIAKRKLFIEYLSVAQLELIAKRVGKGFEDLQQEDIKSFLTDWATTGTVKDANPFQVFKHLRLKYYADYRRVVPEVESEIDEVIRIKCIDPIVVDRSLKAGRKTFFKLLGNLLPDTYKARLQKFMTHTERAGGETMEQNPDYQECLKKYTELVDEWLKGLENFKGAPKEGTPLEPKQSLLGKREREPEWQRRNGEKKSSIWSRERSDNWNGDRYNNSNKRFGRVAVTGAKETNRSTYQHRVGPRSDRGRASARQFATKRMECFNCRGDHVVLRCDKLTPEKRIDMFEEAMKRKNPGRNRFAEQGKRRF